VEARQGWAISSWMMTVFADPGAAEQARLAAAHQRAEQVDDLDAGLETGSVFDDRSLEVGAARGGIGAAGSRP